MTEASGKVIPVMPEGPLFPDHDCLGVARGQGHCGQVLPGFVEGCNQSSPHEFCSLEAFMDQILVLRWQFFSGCFEWHRLASLASWLQQVVVVSVTSAAVPA